MAIDAFYTACQLSRIFFTVVDASYKTVLKGDPSACFVKIISAGIQNLIHGILIRDRHQFLSFFIIWSMKGKCQSDLKLFFSQIIHLRHDPTGRNRHISLTDPKTVFVGKDPDKTDKIVIIIHRLTGSHHNYIGHTFAGICLDTVNLIQHLGRFQASGQSSDGRCTESASHTAAHLRRNAHRISVVIPHENTLDHISIFQLEQIFSGSVNF